MKKLTAMNKLMLAAFAAVAFGLHAAAGDITIQGANVIGCNASRYIFPTHPGNAAA